MGFFLSWLPKSGSTWIQICSSLQVRKLIIIISISVSILCFLRSTGAYVQILSKIFIHDMIPFSAIFSIFLFSFTGAFYFALRGEEFTTTTTTTNRNCSLEMDDENSVQDVTTTELSSLDIFPHLTR